MNNIYLAVAAFGILACSVGCGSEPDCEKWADKMVELATKGPMPPRPEDVPEIERRTRLSSQEMCRSGSLSKKQYDCGMAATSRDEVIACLTASD